MQFIRNRNNESKLRIISLGGFGNVTTNMYVYELLPQGEILLIDCGIGFPSEEMLGIDLLIPDTAYLKDKAHLIKGLILTHGHDDHTGALAYILPQIQMQVYAPSPLTAGFAQLKLNDEGIAQKVNIVDPDKTLRLGSFSVDFIRVNHSTPDSMHLFIKTPAGNIYHGPDYKFDWTPVDGIKPDLSKIAAFGGQGVDLMLTDCLGVQNKGLTPSEKTIREMFEREIGSAQGRVIVTTLSSNISRFRQIIDVSMSQGRKIALVGRSLEKKVDVASNLGYLNFPKSIFVPLEQAARIPDKKITLLVAGSQGQPGSAMDRIADGEHKNVRVKKTDKIIFSSPDYIPGTEAAVRDVIDRLTLLGANVRYEGVAENMHVGGHGGQWDMKLLLCLAKPKYVIPTGGEVRHMKQYSQMAMELGWQEEAVLLPQSGQIIEVAGGKTSIAGKLDVRNIMVDGLGVGDVGNVVLRDRQLMAQEGIVIVVVQINQQTKQMLGDAEVISRGFVYAREHEELIASAKAQVRHISLKTRPDMRGFREKVAQNLARFFWEKTGRRPMIVPVVVEV